MINRAMLYSKFVRYDELNAMMLSNPSTKEIIGHPFDIYIDIMSVYKDVLSSDFVDGDTKTICINVLNMAAHYRHFFRNKTGCKVRVFLVNSLTTATGNICEIQNTIYNDKVFSMVSNLCKYLPDIYYIYRDGFNASSVIYYFMNNVPKSNPTSTLVISNDVYAYQLVLRMNTYLLRVGKSKKFITYNTVIDAFFKNKTPSTDLSPALLPLLMALNKSKALNLDLLYSYKVAIDTVRQCIERGLIYNGYNTPNSLLEEKLGIPYFTLRWFLCDLSHQAMLYTNSPYILDDTWQFKKQCDFNMLASILDSVVNGEIEDNILNYIYLLE